MHSSLFGNLKFSLFPVIILLFSMGTIYSFDFFGFSLNEIQFGMHYLMLFFGLNVGVIGFVSRSSMKNLLGKTNLLIFSSRILPLSKFYILATFLLKDFIFYFGFFILPIVVSNILVTGLMQTLLLAVSYLLSFSIGLGVTFLISVVYVRLNKYLFLILTGAVTYILYSLGLGLRQLNLGYLYYLSGNFFVLVTGIVVVALLLVLGGSFYGFGERRKELRKKDVFSRLSTKLSSLNSKNILDLNRSSGGFGKILVSFIVLGAVFWFMVEKFPPGEIFLQSKLLTISTFLGISSLSIYNWLNRYDRKESYLILPLIKEDILKSKIETFYLITLPLLLSANIAGFFFFNSSVFELMHAVLITFFSATYILAITVSLAGLEPNTRLLDATVILKFFAFSFLVLEPFLLGALIYNESILFATGIFSFFYVVSGTVSYILLRTELGGEF